MRGAWSGIMLYGGPFIYSLLLFLFLGLGWGKGAQEHVLKGRVSALQTTYTITIF